MTEIIDGYIELMRKAETVDEIVSIGNDIAIYLTTVREKKQSKRRRLQNEYSKNIKEIKEMGGRRPQPIVRAEDIGTTCRREEPISYHPEFARVRLQRQSSQQEIPTEISVESTIRQAQQEILERHFNEIVNGAHDGLTPTGIVVDDTQGQEIPTEISVESIRQAQQEILDYVERNRVEIETQTEREISRDEVLRHFRLPSYVIFNDGILEYGGILYVVVPECSPGQASYMRRNWLGHNRGREVLVNITDWLRRRGDFPGRIMLGKIVRVSDRAVLFDFDDGHIIWIPLSQIENIYILRSEHINERNTGNGR